MMQISAEGHDVANKESSIASIVWLNNNIVISINDRELFEFNIFQWPEVFEFIISGTASPQRMRSLSEMVHSRIPFDGLLGNHQVFVSMIHLAGEINNRMIEPSCGLSLQDIRKQFIEQCLFRDKLQSGHLLYVLSDHLQNKLQKHIRLKNAVLCSGHVYELKLQADGHEEIIYYRPYSVPNSSVEIAQNDADELISTMQKEYSKAVKEERAKGQPLTGCCPNQSYTTTRPLIAKKV